MIQLSASSVRTLLNVFNGLNHHYEELFDSLEYFDEGFDEMLSLYEWVNLNSNIKTFYIFKNNNSILIIFIVFLYWLFLVKNGGNVILTTVPPLETVLSIKIRKLGITYGDYFIMNILYTQCSVLFAEKETFKAPQ